MEVTAEDAVRLVVGASDPNFPLDLTGRTGVELDTKTASNNLTHQHNHPPLKNPQPMTTPGDFQPPS